MQQAAARNRDVNWPIVAPLEEGKPDRAEFTRWASLVQKSTVFAESDLSNTIMTDGRRRQPVQQKKLRLGDYAGQGRQNGSSQVCQGRLNIPSTACLWVAAP